VLFKRSPSTRHYFRSQRLVESSSAHWPGNPNDPRSHDDPHWRLSHSYPPPYRMMPRRRTTTTREKATAGAIQQFSTFFLLYLLTRASKVFQCYSPNVLMGD
ncbi:hypothetical protein TNCV_4056591, partial [Trichonephila clavipes]